MSFQPSTACTPAYGYVGAIQSRYALHVTVHVCVQLHATLCRLFLSRFPLTHVGHGMRLGWSGLGRRCPAADDARLAVFVDDIARLWAAGCPSRRPCVRAEHASTSRWRARASNMRLCPRTPVYSHACCQACMWPRPRVRMHADAPTPARLWAGPWPVPPTFSSYACRAASMCGVLAKQRFFAATQLQTQTFKTQIRCEKTVHCPHHECF